MQAQYRLSVAGKGVVGLPSELGGVPLSMTLSELGLSDGATLSIVGTSVSLSDTSPAASLSDASPAGSLPLAPPLPSFRWQTGIGSSSQWKGSPLSAF